MDRYKEKHKEMGRASTSSKGGFKRVAWTPHEDKRLMNYISIHGPGKWERLAKELGLKRCGKSCRLRWLNYLRPGIKRGNFSKDEEDLITRLHKLLGNKWSQIAGRLPGRTDNEIKNHWNTYLAKKAKELHFMTLPRHHMEKECPASSTGEKTGEQDTQLVNEAM